MFLKDCRFWQDFIVCFFFFFHISRVYFKNNLKDFVNKRIFLVSCFLDVLIVFCKRKIRMQRFNHFITDLFLESNLYFRILISLAYSEKYIVERGQEHCLLPRLFQVYLIFRNSVSVSIDLFNS